MTVTGGYQDGWNTPGWTSQWPHLPDATPGNPDLVLGPIPNGLKYVYVTGTWTDYRGKPLWGRVVVTPSVPSFEIDGQIVVLHSYQQELDRGSIRVPVLIALDPSTTSPIDWFWSLRTRVGPDTEHYVLPNSIPGDPDEVSITTLGGATPDGEPPTYDIDGGTA